ncbi:MAG: hypothetical protein GY835_03460, partial [bacterium]|nr:hypothetical protein [bacterium]
MFFGNIYLHRTVACVRLGMDQLGRSTAPIMLMPDPTEPQTQQFGYQQQAAPQMMMHQASFNQGTEAAAAANHQQLFLQQQAAAQQIGIQQQIALQQQAMAGQNYPNLQSNFYRVNCLQSSGVPGARVFKRLCQASRTDSVSENSSTIVASLVPQQNVSVATLKCFSHPFQNCQCSPVCPNQMFTDLAQAFSAQALGYQQPVFASHPGQIPVFASLPMQSHLGYADALGARQLAPPPLTGPGVGMAGVQQGAALNPLAATFQPAVSAPQQSAQLVSSLQSAPALSALSTDPLGQLPSTLQADRSAQAQTAPAPQAATKQADPKLPAALSPISNTDAAEQEDGEIKEDEEPPAKSAKQTIKKPLQFLGISCPSEAQIEWKSGSCNRVIFRDVAEMARKLGNFRKKHLAGTTSAAQVADYNGMAKHVQRVIDHIKLAEEYGWEAVGKV